MLAIPGPRSPPVIMLRWFQKSSSSYSSGALNLFPDEVVTFLLHVVNRVMDDTDIEYAVRVAKEDVNLLVDEEECMEDDGDHHHDEDLTEKDNIEADHIGNQVEDEQCILEWFALIL